MAAGAGRRGRARAARSESPAAIPATKPWKTSPVRSGSAMRSVLGRAGRVEEAKLDRRRRARRRRRRWRRPPTERDAERLGAAGAEAAHRQARGARASSRKSVAYRFAGRVQPTSVAIARTCMRAPQRAVAPQRHGAIDRELELVARHRRELDAGAGARGQRHLVGVDDRVGEAADARDDRDRAVAQRAELGEAAGLEARRHEQRVGAALQRDARATRRSRSSPRRARGGGAPPRRSRLERLVAGAEERELRAARSVIAGSASSSRSMPFCQRQSADDAEQRTSPGSASRPKRACSAALFARAARRGVRASKRAARCASVAGFHTRRRCR